MKKPIFFILLLLIFFMGGCGPILHLTSYLLQDSREDKGGNNPAPVSRANLDVISAPDLTFHEFQLNDFNSDSVTLGLAEIEKIVGVEGKAGIELTVRAIITNQGNVRSTNIGFVNYYESVNRNISTNDTLIGIDNLIRLNPGGKVGSDTTITFLPLPGNYYFGACIEDILPTESDNENNCSDSIVVTVTAPNLIVESFTINSFSTDSIEFVVGTEVTLKANIQNLGNISSTNFEAVFYRSLGSGSESQINQVDIEINRSNFPLAGGGSSRVYTKEVTIPKTQDATIYYFVCVESIKPVESVIDEDDNCSENIAVTVTAPDLTVGQFLLNGGTKPITVTGGATLNLGANIQNLGDGFPSSPTQVKYYRSDDDSIISTEDSEVGTSIILDLPSGVSSLVIGPSIAAPNSTGTYYYGACVVVQDNESNQDNNCSPGIAVTVR